METLAGKGERMEVKVQMDRLCRRRTTEETRPHMDRKAVKVAIPPIPHFIPKPNTRKVLLTLSLFTT